MGARRGLPHAPGDPRGSAASAASERVPGAGGNRPMLHTRGVGWAEAALSKDCPAYSFCRWLLYYRLDGETARRDWSRYWDGSRLAAVIGVNGIAVNRPSYPRDVRAPGRGAQHPVPSLVSATLLGSFPMRVDEETGEIIDGPVGVSVIEYMDGVELSAVPTTGPRRRRDPMESELRMYEHDLREVGPEEANQRAAQRREGKSARSVEESARRARSRVRRVVRYYGLRYMVTLTFPGDGVHEYNRALRLLQDFIHDHGATLRLGGHYVCVPELHPGGHGWHWHALVCRRFSKAELRALWEGWTAFLTRRGMAPSGGAQFVRVDVKDWGSAAAASGYATKYVSKAFEDGGLRKNRRRFLASQGAVVEAQRATAESLDEVEAVACAVPGAFVRRLEGEGGRPPIVWAIWDSA